MEVRRLEAQTLRRERDIQEQKFAKRLGQTPTDSQGEFFLGYHTEEFADLFKANPALFLMVLDASGRALFTSQQPFHAERGRVEQSEIRLSGTVPSLARGGGKTVQETSSVRERCPPFRDDTLTEHQP